MTDEWHRDDCLRRCNGKAGLGHSRQVSANLWPRIGKGADSRLPDVIFNQPFPGETGVISCH